MLLFKYSKICNTPHQLLQKLSAWYSSLARRRRQKEAIFVRECVQDVQDAGGLLLVGRQDLSRCEFKNEDSPRM